MLQRFLSAPPKENTIPTGDIGIRLENEAFNQSQLPEEVPDRQDPIKEYCAKLKKVLIEIASRYQSLDDGKREWRRKDAKNLLAGPRAVLADDRFIVTQNIVLLLLRGRKEKY